MSVAGGVWIRLEEILSYDGPEVTLRESTGSHLRIRFEEDKTGIGPGEQDEWIRNMGKKT